MKRLTIELGDAEHRELRMKAARDGKSMAVLVRGAMCDSGLIPEDRGSVVPLGDAVMDAIKPGPAPPEIVAALAKATGTTTADKLPVKKCKDLGCGYAGSDAGKPHRGHSNGCALWKLAVAPESP